MAPETDDVVDLRSDTVTRPTDEMREAMATAEVGNSAFGEDPTVAELETLAADRLGKEAALFLPSGTMGNQASLLVWCNRLPDRLRAPEVLLEADSHINAWESGGLARISRAQAHPVPSDRGALDPAAVDETITGIEAYPIKPVTAVVCLEDTHNASGGSVVPLANLDAVAEVAQTHDVPTHLDGARLFNAAVASGQPVDRRARGADSVMVSLSKGLACPIGSVVAGSSAFIDQLEQARGLLGGAMRQAGIVAAAGIVALGTMVDRLADDHANARALAEGLVEHDGIELAQATVDTNIVYVDIEGLGVTPKQFCARLEEHGVRLDSDTGGSIVRGVTHLDVTREDIDRALAATAEVVGSL